MNIWICFQAGFGSWLFGEVLGSCCSLGSSPGSVSFYSCLEFLDGPGTVLVLAGIVDGMSCPSRRVSAEG